jgi:hypothetical protein
LRPVLEGSATRTTWRTAILLEPRSSISGIRTSEGRKYIEYEDGFKEFYDLKTDPYELRNLVYYREVPQATLDRLQGRLLRLRGCKAAVCRTAEDETTP